MNRLEKKQSIEEIKNLVEGHTTVIIVHYQGLTVAQVNVLRTKIRESNAKIKVIKNSLAKLAVANGNSSSLDNLLAGPTAVVVSNDPVSVAKILAKFAKDEGKLSLLGGIVEDQYVDVKGLAMLADMPSKDELRAKLLGLISAPASKLVRLISTPASGLARVIGAYSEK